MCKEMIFNGINADTGEYLLPPIQIDLFAKMIGERQFDPGELGELSNWLESIRQGPYGIAAGHDPMHLDQAGWGVIFPRACDPAIMDALGPLLEWRKSQAGEYYQEYQGVSGYWPDDTKNTWLKRYPRKMGPGSAEPKKVPYYLLMVGTPQQIPFDFQTQLDVQYAVGRIGFETVEEYASYARSVVQAEQQAIRLSRQAAFFGVSNPDDFPTQLSLEHLITPLAESFADEHFYDAVPWQVQKLFKADATKANLSQILHGSQAPALLFTASHGMGFPKTDPQRQLAGQGALLCQDWPGRLKWGKQPIPGNFYFSGDDLSANAKIWGSMAFLFACYSAGTPQWDAFLDLPAAGGPEIAPHPFTASLPQRLLSHPNGGALAVIGHVDRAWGFSFFWENAGRQISTYESVLRCLCQGYPVGHALGVFGERYGELSTDLSDLMERARYKKSPPDANELASLWIANNDARNFILLGDPAVRLMV